MTTQALLQLLPIYGVILISVIAAGLGFYPFQKSVMQANAIALLVGTSYGFKLKTNLIYSQSPYTLLISAITVVLALIIINIVIAAKKPKTAETDSTVADLN